MNIQAMRMTAITINFHINNPPACARMPSLANTNGMPPSRVPAGHIHLQNAGTETPFFAKKYRGNAMTKTNSIPYFNRDSQRLHLPFLIFGAGIL